MNDNMLGYGEWLQNYQETLAGEAALPGGLSHDATIVTTSANTNHNTLSPSNSGSSGGKLNLNPKDCISKPTRRRSRAAKRTPTTHLNANATNFRALVQQFTGCRGGTTLSFGTQTGPLNLNFSLSSQQNDVFANNSMKAPFGYSYNNHQIQIQAQTQTQTQIQSLKQQEDHHHHHQQQQQMYDQEQPCMFSSPSGGYASTCSNPTTTNILNMEDLLLENISVYELIGDA